MKLLQVQKNGITVAQDWTALPPKAEVEQHLHQALIKAREQLGIAGGHGNEGSVQTLAIHWWRYLASAQAYAGLE